MFPVANPVLFVAAAHTGEIPIDTSNGYVRSEPPPTVPLIIPATIPTVATIRSSEVVTSNN